MQVRPSALRRAIVPTPVRGTCDSLSSTALSSLTVRRGWGRLIRSWLGGLVVLHRGRGLDNGDGAGHLGVDLADVGERPRGGEGVAEAGSRRQFAGIERAVAGGRRVRGRAGIGPGDRGADRDLNGGGVEGKVDDGDRRPLLGVGARAGHRQG